jgi:hypothetical protein
MTTDYLCFYFQNRLIQTSQTEVNSSVILPPLVFPDMGVAIKSEANRSSTVVEHLPHYLKVAGSSPVACTINILQLSIDDHHN